MLEVELDIFSGMPNPKWILSEQEEKELLDRLLAEPEQISPVYSPDEVLGLGYCGLIVREIKTDERVWTRVNRSLKNSFPQEFRIGSKPARHVSVEEWLLKTSEKKGSRVTDELREVAANGVRLITPLGEDANLNTEGKKDKGDQEGRSVNIPWQLCNDNHFDPNIELFNMSQYVGLNNCYCFASNHLANRRYARPGLKGGRPAREMTCGEVIAGLKADGWKETVCAQNTLTIACVVWPGNDYHFYRLVSGEPGYMWGHKRGGTPARYTDECGRAIVKKAFFLEPDLDPTNICREDYTHFCGFFYQDNTTAFVQ
ncbi:MAG: hypothetical protein WB502_15210 [Thermoactinomyces sp.]